MTIREAAYQIMNEFYEYECELDSGGRKEVIWIVENKTEYDFERYWLNVVARNKDNIIIEKGTVYVEYLPTKEKRRVSYTLPKDTCRIEMTVNDFSVINLNKCNKEEHITDLYRADVLNYKEYKDIHNYLFAGADE